MLTGLILTDTQRLASLLSSNQNKVKEVVASYVSSCASYIDWQIVDTSDKIYADLDKTNCRSLLSLLNKEDYEERILLAEVNRNIWNFDLR